MIIIIFHNHFVHVVFVSILVFQTFYRMIFWHIDFSWNTVVRDDSTGPTNCTRSEKVWEPLR